MTARKLDLEKESTLGQACPRPTISTPEWEDEAWKEKLQAKRDTVLALSPELSLWFGTEQLMRVDV